MTPHEQAAHDAKTDEWLKPLVEIVADAATAARLAAETLLRMRQSGIGPKATSPGGLTSPLSARPATESDEQPKNVPAGIESLTGLCADQPLGDVPTSVRPREALPRPIEPADVRVGMVVERRKADTALRARVTEIGDNGWICGLDISLWWTDAWDYGWSLRLIEDAPEPPDPDAALVESLAEAFHGTWWSASSGDDDLDWPDLDDDGRGIWRADARSWIERARAEGLIPEAGA